MMEENDKNVPPFVRNINITKHENEYTVEIKNIYISQYLNKKQVGL